MSLRPGRKHPVMKGLLLLLAGLTARVAATDLQELPPEEFTRRPAVQARVDFAAFDPALMSAAIFHETNRVRRQAGLAPFAHRPQLDRAADMKAVIGVVQGELTHENPLPLTATPADRVRAAGLDYRQVAENIGRLGLFDLPPGLTQVGVRPRGGRSEYYHLDTKEAVALRTYAGFAEAVVRSWMESPGHRANLVNPDFTALGTAARPCRSLVGNHEQVYAVQVFCVPK